MYYHPEVLDITVHAQHGDRILRVGENGSIQCLFKGALEAIIIRWLKDGAPITTSSHSEKPQGEMMFVSNLMIYGITKDSDYANYSCFGYYDESKVTAERIIISNTKSAILHVQDDSKLVVLV